MKRVKNSDIKFKINKKLVYLPNFVIRFYTVNQKEYFFEKTQDDLVSYEREATVDDVEVILSGGTTVTEYYLPLNWSELLFVGQGILNYKLTNNIEDPEFPDYQYNKEEVVTTDFYIDSIKVDPEPEESLIERVIQLEEHLDEEIVNREEADAAISGAVDSEIARAISAETALDEIINDEIERAISAETAIVDALEAEADRAISAETALDAKIDQEIADRIADVNAEEARAISAETALDAKIDAETNRATSAETALQTAINDEATARANADTALQTAITNEESRAREAESAITNALNAEVTRATGAENALDTKIDAETTRATGAEAALDVKIDTVSGNVISETTRATTAENALSGAIDSISAATSGSVEELDAKIDQEIADRTADVDAEETRAKGVEDVLSGAIDTIDAKFIDDAKYEDSGNTKVINFYNGNTVKATIDCTDFIKDGMISTVELIPSGSTSVLVITWNTDGGSKVTTIDIGDIFEADNYYQKSETSGATEIATALSAKLDSTAYTPTDLSNYYQKSETSGATEISTALSNKLDATAYTPTDLSNYYTKSETSGATELSNAFAQKLGISDFNTYSGAVDTALSGKQATLVSSENIKTINNESILGSGNIDIQGGGSTYSGVSGVTINNNNEIYYDGIYKTWLTSNHSNNYAVYWFRGANAKIWISDSAPTSSNMSYLRPQFSFGGVNNLGSQPGAVAFGQAINVSGFYASSFGQYNYSKNKVEFSVGQYNTSSSASATWGDSGNTLFSVGNGTSNSARHNAFEIRQNGDIYLTLDGQDVKLQDHLGGGGGITSGEVQTMITSATTPICQTIEDNEEVTAEALNVLNAALSGKADSSDVYLKSETSGATEISTALAEKLAVNDFDTYSAATDTLINSKASQSTVDALNDVVSSHTSDNTIHLTSGDVQTQIENSISGKVNVSDNVVSAHSFDKSTKIYYPGITAERRPSIPSGTKKISISFTMLPSNNQLFETLQFVTFNPFNIVDVASGLTVGVSEDMSTFPITYTVTSVTWTGDDSIMAYDLSENDTLLNLYAQGDYEFSSVVPKGINSLEMYIDVLEDIESGQTAEVVNDGVVKNFENIGKYLQDERNRVDNKIDNKLDATAYTPTIVDSSLRQGSTNPVENGAIFDEVRVQTSSGGGETILIFDENNETTNYPLGTTEFIVWADTTERFVNYTFYNDSTKLGNVTVAYFDTVNVTQNNLPGATYTISGEFVTFTYQPLGITKIVRNGDGFVEKVINPPTYTSLKSVVNTKQNQLTPGTGISIQNDVISVTASSPSVDAYTKAESDGKFATITNFSSHSGNSDIHITSSERAYWNNKSNFSGNYNDLTNKPTIPIKTSQLENDSEYISYPAIKDMATKTWVGEQGYLTEQDISGKQDVSGMTAYTQNSTFNAYTAATNSALASKQDTLTAGTGISIVNDVISVTASSPSVDAYTKAESDGKFATITNFNSHTGNTTHITSSERVYWNNKSDFSGSYNDLTDKPTIPNYTAGSGITISNNVISAKIWSGTQAQYDALAVKDNDTIYLIYNS